MVFMSYNALNGGLHTAHQDTADHSEAEPNTAVHFRLTVGPLNGVSPPSRCWGHILTCP